MDVENNFESNVSIRSNKDTYLLVAEQFIQFTNYWKFLKSVEGSH